MAPTHALADRYDWKSERTRSGRWSEPRLCENYLPDSFSRVANALIVLASGRSVFVRMAQRSISHVASAAHHKNVSTISIIINSQKTTY
jgi:hypothetical protein